MSKITGVAYHPDAQHPDWTTLLEAIPPDVRDYLQIRLGQAITGHTPPDDVLLVMHGGGSNAKTTFAETLSRAIGEYYLMVSDRVLMGNPGDHPTEMMDFMGVRYAVLEETPEARRLDTQRLKKTVGTPRITARRIRQDSVTYDASHTLIINTNHRPIVDETDHGTWRRLQLVTFPYRFRKPWEAIEGPMDRRGDMGLRDRCITNPKVWEAALAWLVDGASKWYANNKEMPEPPASVQRDTRAWRKESDLLLSYMDERITFDPDSHVLSTELFADFNAWLKTRGHPGWTDRTFASRFGQHDEAGGHRVERRKIKPRAGLSRAPMTGDPWDYKPTPAPGSSAYWAWLGVRFDPHKDVVDGKNEAQPLSSENVDPVPQVPTSSDKPDSPHEERLTNSVGTVGTGTENPSMVPTLFDSPVPTVPPHSGPGDDSPVPTVPASPTAPLAQWQPPIMCGTCDNPTSTWAHFRSCLSTTEGDTE